MTDLEYRLLRGKPSRLRSTITVTTKVTVNLREGEFCAYCGTGEGPFEFDHIYPRSLGGSSEPNNLALACRPCNQSKSGRTLREWFAGR